MAAPPAAAPAERRIPRVREAPLLGSLRAAQRDRLGFFLRVARECGDIGQFRLGPARGVFLNAPELVHALLVERTRDFDKGAFQRRPFRAVAGDGVFIAEGAARQRRLLAPAFTPRRVAGYADTMVACAERAQAA